MKYYKILFAITIISLCNCLLILNWSSIDLYVNITTINTTDKDVMVKEDSFSGRLFPYFLKPSESVTKTLEYESTGYKQGIVLENAKIKLVIFTTDSSGAFTKFLMEKTVIPDFPFYIHYEYDEDLIYNDTILIQ